MPTTILHTTAIIIGAGPAGAATSLFLSKQGIPHVVIDKANFPRDKVCGDACSGKTALVINRANPQWMQEILADGARFTPSWGITFVAPNGKALEIPFLAERKPTDTAPGFTVPRLVLDNFLVQKMASPHCTLLQGATVQQLTTQNGETTVEVHHGGQDYRITAHVLVGADGDKGIVRRQYMGHNEAEKTNAVGLRAYYSGVTGLHPENFIELHFLPGILPGYLWIFPLPGGMVNVGVGIVSDQVRRKKINLRASMLQALQHHPLIAPRFSGATLHGKIQGWGLPMAMGQMPLSGHGFLLTGDAASLIDPFSGEGIGNALYSGMLAAAAIHDATTAQDYSAPFLKKAYDDVLYRRLGTELQLSATLQRLCRYPWLFNLVVNKACKSASLRHTISSMFSDIDIRSRLSRPSFYLDILMNR